MKHGSTGNRDATHPDDSAEHGRDEVSVRNDGTPDEFFGEDDPGIAENVAAQVFEVGWTTTLSEPPGGGTRFEFGDVVVLEGSRYVGTSTQGGPVHD